MRKKRLNLGPLFTGDTMSTEEYRAAAAKHASESAVQESVVRALQLHGYVVIRINSGASKREYTTKDGKRKFSWIRNYIIYGVDKYDSFPDLLAMKGEGKAAFSGLLIECKSAKGKLTPGQKALREFFKLFGVTIHEISNWRDAKTLLENLR